MMMTIRMPHRLFAPQDAEKTAAAMQAHDPEWKYVVSHDPTGTGYSFISIYDEENEFVGRVT